MSTPFEGPHLNDDELHNMRLFSIRLYSEILGKA